ncbi:hypothetical protein BDY24DRAFT_386177 [Mrakia frigida]|uniref:uncharacterized protein n=1 Tax=Mrakia frigida TaxID=29902 RepID=UPI003FCC1449
MAFELKLTFVLSSVIQATLYLLSTLPPTPLEALRIEPTTLRPPPPFLAELTSNNSHPLLPRLASPPIPLPISHLHLELKDGLNHNRLSDQDLARASTVPEKEQEQEDRPLSGFLLPILREQLPTTEKAKEIEDRARSRSRGEQGESRLIQDTEGPSLEEGRFKEEDRLCELRLQPRPTRGSTPCPRRLERSGGCFRTQPRKRRTRRSKKIENEPQSRLAVEKELSIGGKPPSPPQPQSHRLSNSDDDPLKARTPPLLNSFDLFLFPPPSTRAKNEQTLL